MNRVVILFNLQNEIVHPDGAIAVHGNAAEVARRGVLSNAATLLRAARRVGAPVIHVGSGFDERYHDLNRHVPQFADLERTGRMRIGGWGARFHEQVAPEDGDVVLYRGGLGAFAATPIADHLPPPDETRVYVAGVSTRLVVEAATFELTDHGYAVSVVEDCCAAAVEAVHDDAILVLARFAAIESVDEVTASFGPVPVVPHHAKEQSHG